jgi:hypothetical protein
MTSVQGSLLAGQGQASPAAPGPQPSPNDDGGRLEGHVAQVEALVTDSLRITQGGCALDARAAVEAAVRRARTKGRMLRDLDSGLLLGAVQVRCPGVA